VLDRTHAGLSAYSELPPLLQANPIDSNSQAHAVQPSRTQTISARTVFHQANAMMRPFLDDIQTEEQLDEFMENFADFWYVILSLVCIVLANIHRI
jgi:hypothetical protein